MNNRQKIKIFFRTQLYDENNVPVADSVKDKSDRIGERTLNPFLGGSAFLYAPPCDSGLSVLNNKLVYPGVNAICNGLNWSQILQACLGKQKSLYPDSLNYTLLKGEKYGSI